VEDARRWFWGPPDKQSSRLLKGPWTHCPDDKSLANVIKRLQLCRTLCDETSKRLMKAFEHFLLCLKSVAFAPLLLTFCAISARFNSQIQRVTDLTLVCSEAVTRLLQNPASTPPSLGPRLGVAIVPTSAAAVDVDPRVEAVEPATDPPSPSALVLFTPQAVPPLIEEKKAHAVTRKPKKHPMDEIDEIFGF